MTSELRYGADSTLSLDLPPEVLVADCSAPPGVPLEDPAAAVAAALLDPLDFPPLAQAMLPGDCVALALDRDVPQSAAVVAGVVQTLLESQIEPCDITIVRTQADARFEHKDPTALLPGKIRQCISVVTHDPDNRNELSFLAASKEGQAIYINRALCEAELVVTIGCLRMEQSLGWVGIHGGLYPVLADRAAQQRFLAPSSTDTPALHQRRQREADEAAWLLGVHFTVQIVPGAGDTVLHVLAGHVPAIMARGQELCRAAWNRDIPQRASLVVATVEGAGDQQTWDHFARALSAASRAVDENGAIAICMDLNTSPGPALKRLAGVDSPEEKLRQIRKDRSRDAVPAAQLLRTLEHAQVYLLSRLDEDTVEQLGVGHVASSDEIARLSSRHKSCILLANAQYAVPTPPEVD